MARVVEKAPGEEVRIRLIVLLVFCCAAGGGCTSVYFCSAGDSMIRQAPENDRPFKLLGPVDALVWQWVLLYYVPLGPTYQEAEVLLVREAKRMGADAVINVRFHTENDSDETSLSHMGITGFIPFLINTRAYHFSGLAIKYTDRSEKK
jgi:hypothetical protein